MYGFCLVRLFYPPLFVCQFLHWPVLKSGPERLWAFSTSVSTLGVVLATTKKKLLLSGPESSSPRVCQVPRTEANRSIFRFISLEISDIVFANPARESRVWSDISPTPQTKSMMSRPVLTPAAIIAYWKAEELPFSPARRSLTDARNSSTSLPARAAPSRKGLKAPAESIKAMSINCVRLTGYFDFLYAFLTTEHLRYMAPKPAILQEISWPFTGSSRSLMFLTLVPNFIVSFPALRSLMVVTVSPSCKGVPLLSRNRGASSAGVSEA